MGPMFKKLFYCSTIEIEGLDPLFDWYTCTTIL